MTDAGDGAAPPGFVAVGGQCGPFILHSGPLYGRLVGDELTLGVRVLERHTNPLGCAHGGLLSSLADMLLAASAMYRVEGRGQVLPTISLQLDFLALVRLGEWVEGRAQILRSTRTLIFSQACFEVDGQPVLRASGILKRNPDAVLASGGWDPLELRRP